MSEWLGLVWYVPFGMVPGSVAARKLFSLLAFAIRATKRIVLVVRMTLVVVMMMMREFLTARALLFLGLLAKLT